MKFSSLKLKNHRLYLFLTKNRKYLPILFFAGGFLWDWLTLGRVDRLYDMILLSTYFVLLSFCICLYNMPGNRFWKYKFPKKYYEYLPLVIQFFFGGLTSAYVIYFSRSVSLSKTASFFTILILLFFSNEIFKKRISNLYFQMSFYAFISFTFFAYMIPVLVAKMNSFIFIISGILSLIISFSLIQLIYNSNEAIQHEISKLKLLTLVIFVYAFISIFYFFKLIPPVPLALNKSIVAHQITKTNDGYAISYEANDWAIFWRDYKQEINVENTDKVYVFTSVFAPTDLNKKIYHQWKKYNKLNDNWEVTDKIGFTILGGRKKGFRGYTYKQNLTEGEWEVEVITEEGLIIGVVNFQLNNSAKDDKKLKSITI